jgi:predicted permease
MDLIRILFNRCAALLNRHELDGELDDELRAHIDFAIEENMKRGLSAQQARTKALRDFGGVTQLRERYRMQRGVPFLEQTVRDIRFGIRQLRGSPGFAATAILTMALGLGANTAVFSLINGLLLRPLPVPHADELAVIRSERSDSDRSNYSFSAPLFRALEKRHDVFQEVAAYSTNQLQVRSSSGNLRIPGALVSGEFFQAIETPPLTGRYLTPADDRPGGASAGFGVVITEGFWQAWFNRAPDVVGRKLTIANTPFAVVGVMPRQFVGPDPAYRPEIYLPLWAEPVVDAPYNNIAAGYHSWWMQVIARRKLGVSLEQSNAALRAISNPILDETAPDDANWIKDARDHHFQLVAEPGSKGYSYLRQEFRKPLVAVFGLCGAMLLLACLNLTSLLMARAAARERELATRLAMGATRTRLIQQLLVESFLIASLGTAAGMVAAPVVSASLAALIAGRDSTAVIDTSLDLRVFLFAAVVATLASILVGLIPALRATGGNLNEQIKIGSHATSQRERRRLLPRALMGIEVALALMLVVGAGLLATSLARLYRTGLGFEPRGLVNLNLDMGKQALDGDALFRWYREFGDALAHRPGVRSVSFASEMPLSGSMWINTFHSPLSNGDQETYMNAVAPAYFETMRIPLLTGRDFQWNDTLASGRKIILNQSAAKQFFPGQSAIGQHVVEGKDSYEVMAVVGDTHYTSIREEAPAAGYVPITQTEMKKPSYTAVVRIEGPPAPLAAAARQLAAQMAPDIPAPVMTTMSNELDASISSERMMAMLSVFFAACALLVTGIGLYGTLAYATARRTSEIGIRMALGAQRAQVVTMVFRENAWIAAGGSIAGLAAALLASRALAGFLYGTSVRDPWVMLASVVALALVACAASLLPAIRASRIEPMRALRSE